MPASAIGSSYPPGMWSRTTSVFDFSESKRMANAAELVTAVDGKARVAPLLVMPVGRQLGLAAS
eukprot:4570371-Prymnesium_polylepis.1